MTERANDRERERVTTKIAREMTTNTKVTTKIVER